MTAGPLPPSSPLRELAEARLAAAPPAVADDALADTLRLLHELQVHQVELQLQNDELLAAQRELSAALKRQTVLYDDAPVGYCTLAADGTILQANTLAGSLLNTPAAALPGQRLEQLLTPDGAAALRSLLLRTTTWASAHTCEAMTGGDAADPTQEPRMLQVEARHEPDSATTLLALIDVSERQRAQALKHRAEVAEQANQAKSMFFAQMNHELRTPLNAILGFSHMLRSQRKVELGDDMLRWVEHVQRAGLHTLALVSDGLDLARIEAGRIDAALEPVDLHDAVHQALVVAAPLAAEGGIALECTASTDLPHMALATPRLLQQVLLNLLSNAIKYNQPRGTVQVALRHEAGRAIIDVTDTGRGLSAEQMTHLFQPFDRLGAEKGSVEGTGLGLLISRRLAEAMGGSLTLRSVVGTGTTATLELAARG